MSSGASGEAMWTRCSPRTVRSSSRRSLGTSLSHRRCPFSTARDSACPRAQPCSSGARSSSGLEICASSGTSATLKRVRSPTRSTAATIRRTSGSRTWRRVTGSSVTERRAMTSITEEWEVGVCSGIGMSLEERGARCVHPVSRYGSLFTQEEGPSSCSGAGASGVVGTGWAQGSVEGLGWGHGHSRNPSGTARPAQRPGTARRGWSGPHRIPPGGCGPGQWLEDPDPPPQRTGQGAAGGH